MPHSLWYLQLLLAQPARTSSCLCNSVTVHLHAVTSKERIVSVQALPLAQAPVEVDPSLAADQVINDAVR